jgi:hypothetical protein
MMPMTPRGKANMVGPLRIALLGVVAGAAPALAQSLDTARALSALRDARAICTADAGAVWGTSLCGPIALVDRPSRLVIANDTVAGQRFLPYGNAYVTTLPANRFIANTSFSWGGREWTMVTLPLPADRYARVTLIMHEVFHREQKVLGLRQSDALNNHLDFREGRTWLRLEYRALAEALRSADPGIARRHAENALLFRARRRLSFPGSDSTEASLEIQEGLPEYTGHRLAMRLTGADASRPAQHLQDYEKMQSFVRAFAYGTGPALGLLLDRFAPAWRLDVRNRRDPGALLALALGFRAPRDLDRAARSRAAQYGWAVVDREELARDSARAPMLRDFRARLGDGPTITFRQTIDSLSWGFDPTALVAFDLTSVVYPTGSFTAPWGSLNVERNGVWVRNDFTIIRVAVGGPNHLTGDGWTLKLNPGWAVEPDPDKPGSFEVCRR